MIWLLEDHAWKSTKKGGESHLWCFVSNDKGRIGDKEQQSCVYRDIESGLLCWPKAENSQMNSFSRLEVIRILCKLIKSHPFGKSVWIKDLIEPLLVNVVGVRACYASVRVASMCLWKSVQIHGKPKACPWFSQVEHVCPGLTAVVGPGTIFLLNKPYA